jgi:NAD(P)-dependent dehydrogenase (short-subunit alcohol dehydrogenase family)
MKEDAMRLKDKVALITGGGSGMGREMAKLFAAEGAKVVVGEWNEASLAEVVAEVKAAGGEITGVQGSVADEADCARMIDAATGKYGRLDILCNNAGVMDLFSGVAEMDDATFERVMGVNVKGPMFLTRKAVPIMKAQGGGSIVNTGSVAGVGGAAAGAAYTMSKHALVGLSKSTAYRYAGDGIRSNVIACGGVETNIMSSIDQTKMDMESLGVLGKWHGAMPAQLKPIEIAYVALFLASDESIHINGVVLPADAGWTAA